MLEHDLNNPGNKGKESPFRFPVFTDEEVVAVANELGLYIKRCNYGRGTEIRAAVYGLQGRRVENTNSDFITEVPNWPPATVFRQALSFLEAEVAEELDPETLLVRPVNALQTTDTLADMALGGRRYCATVRHQGETSKRVTLEARRVRNHVKYERDVRGRVLDLIAERRARADTLREELRQAYESAVLGH